MVDLSEVRTRIKICGITQERDALAAVSAGVDALGFIFAEQSPRKIGIEQAQRINSQLPAFITSVGVFVNQSGSYIDSVAKDVGLDLLQLHGDENSEFALQRELPYIKAVRVRSYEDVRHASASHPRAKGLLLDAFHPTQHGGTGKVIDRDALVGINSIAQPIILAGGLGPENVENLIAEVKPFAVDLNSGLEESPGVKNHQLIKSACERIINCRQ